MMTTAALLLALITSSPNAEAAAEPVLLDFHSMVPPLPPDAARHPAVDPEGLPGQVGRRRGIPGALRALPGHGRPDLHRGRPLGPDPGQDQGPATRPELADLYRIAKAKLGRSPRRRRPAGREATAAEEDADEDARSQDRPDDEAEAVASTFANPKPWETVVRIKVHDAGAIGLGSGTVIHSTPQESIILTCAHIFKLQGGRQPKQASQFPRTITVDLFDGKLSGRDRGGPQGRDGRGRGDGLRLRPRRRPDPHPPGASAAGVARRPRVVAAREADADDHRRLLGGARRDDLGDDRSPSPACEGCGQPELRGDRVQAGPEAGEVGRGPLHVRRLSRGGLRLRRAEGEPRPLRLAPVDPQPARPQPPDRAVHAGHEPTRDAARPGTPPRGGRRRRPSPGPVARPRRVVPGDDPPARPAGNPVADGRQGRPGRTAWQSRPATPPRPSPMPRWPS